jgi:hypothetical protein
VGVERTDCGELKCFAEVVNMGLAKEEELRKDAAWARLCEEKGWVCGYCREIPARGEAPDSEPYICGHCQHHLDED